jgi:hypothetical protein
LIWQNTFGIYLLGLFIRTERNYFNATYRKAFL